MNRHTNDLFAILFVNPHNLLFLHVGRLKAHVFKIDLEIFIKNQSINYTNKVGGSFVFYL
jgi:hypothetical protein